MTLAPTPIEIHEFSTGIRPDRTPDGGWVSLGFTGQYMNATIDPVPYPVQRSIANKEFAIAEGASSDNPAIVGRVVMGGNDGNWSVVAVVNRGRDEKGRSASLYRYFLAQGADNLIKIVAWLEQQQRNGKKIFFDPFEIKLIGQPNRIQIQPSYQPLSREMQTWLNSQTAPVLVPIGQQYTFSQLNVLGIEKAKNNNQSVAWAFNVEALEQPNRFQIILPASDRAFQLIQKALGSNRRETREILNIDEQAIKAAIKNLINSSTVKPDSIQALFSPIKSDKPPSKEYWQGIFDGLGASNALRQGIFSPQMVRLLTLRAIIIPETLKEYLDWLNISENYKKRNPNQNISLALEFQSQLVGFSEIITSVTKGNEFILSEMLRNAIASEIVSWLLTCENGVWSNLKTHTQLVQNIKHDLGAIGNSYQTQTKLDEASLKSYPFLLRDLQINYRLQSNGYYEPLADIFNNLGEHALNNLYKSDLSTNYYQLSAYFYQVSQGSVPRKLFLEKAFQGQFRGQTILFGKRLFQENYRNIEVEEDIVSKRMVVILIIISLLIGAIGGAIGSQFLSKADDKRGDVTSTYPSIPDPSDKTSNLKDEIKGQGNQYLDLKNKPKNTPTKAPEKKSPTMTTEQESKAMNVFTNTQKTLEEEIIPDILANQSLKTEKKKIIGALEKVLNITPGTYDNAIKNSNEKDNKLKLINGIFSYQKTKSETQKDIQVCGYLQQNGYTNTFLKEDIQNELIKKNDDQ